MDEKQLQLRIWKYLIRYFNVKMEVWSRDHTKRIDIAMVHKSDTKREYPIGIEIKTFDKKTGSDAGKWLFQAQSYSNLEFEGYNKMLIVVAPQFSGNVFLEGKLMHQHIIDGDPSQDHNVSTFLGQFNIGEFQRYNYVDHINRETKRLARIVYNGLIIWDEKRDSFRPNNFRRQ
jgi:hypothetical protein